LLAVIAVIASVHFLRLAQPVAMPHAFAMFMIALLWPIQARLDRR
jgi:predicted PurR-regulated permease PerM